MAFSYSDNNFTVIGNLCFVHIRLDGTKTDFDIPPAISDRMLFNRFSCIYLFRTGPKDIGSRSVMPNIGFAEIINGKIVCTDEGVGYLSFYFPIDSNK